MDTGHWKVYEAVPEDAFGFIYEITNLIDGRKYIGRKQMIKKIRRMPLKGEDYYNGIINCRIGKPPKNFLEQ